MTTVIKSDFVRSFDTINLADIGSVGGKNASLGEMIQALSQVNVQVPFGFATTATAYWTFLDENRLKPLIKDQIDSWRTGKQTLEATGKTIRQHFLDTQVPDTLEKALNSAYDELCRHYHQVDLDVAVRSSATAEDLPEASFAGQQETFLNITGKAELLLAFRRCLASLFTDRAISYREQHGFDHLKVALSVGVQKMVRSDLAGSGVMFTIDTESGFPDVVVINAAWGLGENVVQGTVNPDEYTVFKPLLQGNYQPIIDKKAGLKEKKLIYASGSSKSTVNMDTTAQERQRYVLADHEILCLAQWAKQIEAHYGKPMDIEWAKDGLTHDLFIVQARPETVQSRNHRHVIKIYKLREKKSPVLTGVAIGTAIAQGKLCVIHDVKDIDQFVPGCILVTEMTDPDWGPIMKQSAGIITDCGGRTCHAAIVAREYGIPTIVGTEHATRILKSGQEITLSCAQGDTGAIYEGIIPFDVKELDVTSLPPAPVKIMLNLASPDTAFQWWHLPADGIGLLRMEFIIGNLIRIHPMALVQFDSLKDEKAKFEIARLTRGYEDKKRYFVELLARGLAKISASRYPKPVIIRMSDFKTNEYANLLGGHEFEPHEENPMIGFRGASRYYDDRYRQGFALECQAIKRLRETMGFGNVIVMIPFCRTVEEADRVLAEMAQNGLKRGVDGLQVYVMAEIPSNIILAEEFARRFDGFSIGSNDLTQLVLGIDRNSAELTHLFDERNEAVKRMLLQLIEKAHRSGCQVGICGQAPSDYPEFAQFLVQAGIDSISLNPDSVATIRQTLHPQGQ